MRGIQRVVAVLLVAWATRAGGEYLETEVVPREQDLFKSARFSIYIPEGVKRVRAVIVHQHGCGRDGIGMPQDLQWQALADKHGAALMGSHFLARDKCTDWHEPENGSEWAFMKALAVFAHDGKRLELEEAPWVLWGHSGGAHWVMAMTARRPERVVAVFARSGGQIARKEMYEVPVMLQLGAREEEGRFGNLYNAAEKVFAAGRDGDAVWSWAVDPKSEHDTAQSRQLAIPFFDACMRERLSDEGRLRAVDRSKGWIGDVNTGAVMPAAQYRGEKRAASWLMDQAVAETWREFVATGQVDDRTPPDAPADVVAREEEGRVMLTWRARADLESGIRAFHIYRDGEKVAAWMGEGKRQAFQAANYGDEPVPRRVEMRWVDEKPRAGGRYEVAVVNGQGMESKRTAAR